jgi:hypothetical protein
MKKVVTYCCAFILLIACESSPERKISFYYWQTNFHLSDVEKQSLNENGVTALYVRYCDVDFKPGTREPVTVSPLRIDTPINITPVVFIKNRVFEANTDWLADSIFKFITAYKKEYSMVQFDCDWTEGTKQSYFNFLRRYKQLSNKPVSATIRLHQVKYPKRSGIPPVDHAVLMYYNMGKIDAGQQNSIYDKATANKYNSYISDYPLPMDAALPIFSWGLKIRDGRVVELLNKIYFSHFKNDSNFSVLSGNRFVTKNACFKGGYYFAKNDVIKIENISADQLLEMADQLSDHPKKIKNIIFYDLDSSNLVQYEKDIFKKVLARIR